MKGSLLIAALSLFACFAALYLLDAFVVFCPTDYIWPVAGDMHCGSLRWWLITGYSVPLVIGSITVMLSMWLRYSRRQIAFAVGPAVILLIGFILTTPLEFKRANHGVIGPDSLINDFRD